MDLMEKLLILSCRLTGCVMTELRRAAAAAKEGLEANAGDADPSDVGSWASTPGNVGKCWKSGIYVLGPLVFKNCKLCHWSFFAFIGIILG